MRRRQYAVIIPDGAGDRLRIEGRSPLAIARTQAMDTIASRGFNGLLRTLDPELPRGSLVAHLGLLGWDQRRYFPHGRASAELLALGTVRLESRDLAFRVNLVRFENRRLVSYNADAVTTPVARPLIERIDGVLRREFPAIELYHNLDFRASLVVRDAGVDPRLLACPEPHELRGLELDVERLIRGGGEAEPLARLLNAYLRRAADLLRGERSNRIMPWSPAVPLRLPSFAQTTGFTGQTAIVGAMDFLHGLAKAGGIDFHAVGNGRVDTDFRGKGACARALLEAGCDFVVCHVNAPDEAAHMGDVRTKIHCLEELDREIVAPLVRYFERWPERLGGLAVIPDHFTNVKAGGPRGDAHSLDPVPFAIWDGRRRDAVEQFHEGARGLDAGEPASPRDFLFLLGVAGRTGRGPLREAAAGYATAQTPP